MTNDLTPEDRQDLSKGNPQPTPNPGSFTGASGQERPFYCQLSTQCPLRLPVMNLRLEPEVDSRVSARCSRMKFGQGRYRTMVMEELLLSYHCGGNWVAVLATAQGFSACGGY